MREVPVVRQRLSIVKTLGEEDESFYQLLLALQRLRQQCWVAFVLTRYALLTRVTAHQSALPKFAYPGLLNLAAPALGAWRQNLASHGVG